MTDIPNQTSSSATTDARVGHDAGGTVLRNSPLTTGTPSEDDVLGTSLAEFSLALLAWTGSSKKDLRAIRGGLDEVSLDLVEALVGQTRALNTRIQSVVTAAEQGAAQRVPS